MFDISTLVAFALLILYPVASKLSLASHKDTNILVMEIILLACIQINSFCLWFGHNRIDQLVSTKLHRMELAAQNLLENLVWIQKPMHYLMYQ